MRGRRPGRGHLSCGEAIVHSTLKLVRTLCESLDAERIAYCHWKSTNALDRSASGQNDLDLLVDRRDLARFTALLYRLGFKNAGAAPDKRMPAVVDYYGFDEESGALVHAHAHYQLILGHDATKNHRLPLERAMLESASRASIFRVPDPGLEFIVFVIRLMLKHLNWGAIVAGRSSPTAAERQELDALEARVDRAWVDKLLERHLPQIDRELFDRCLDSLGPAASPWIQVSTGRKLRAKLRAHTRRNALEDSWLRLTRRVTRKLNRRLLGRRRGHRLASGGAMIAVVGGDGAGKSTAVEALHVWLSRHFDTIGVHLGRPRWSWTTYVVRGLARAARSVGMRPLIGRGVSIARAACTARDRYLAYRKSRRFAINGGLVVCDRYPLPQIKLMDAPQIRRLTAKGMRRGRVLRSLIALEERYYSRILPPDLLLVLRVDPEIAAQRRAEADTALVLARSGEVWQLNWRAHVVDASRSRQQVLAELKSLLWSAL